MCLCFTPEYPFTALVYRYRYAVSLWIRQRIVTAANMLGCMAHVALSASGHTKDRTNAARPQEVYDVLCHLGFKGGRGGLLVVQEQEARPCFFPLERNVVVSGRAMLQRPMQREWGSC